MPWKHVSLGLQEHHFVAWLELWRRHCRAHLPADAAEELIERAEAIGERLRQIAGVNRPAKNGVESGDDRRD